MMLIIAILRYRASAYPLKTPIRKRKLKVFCAMVYIVSFIQGYAISIPICVDKDEHGVLIKIQRFVFIFFCILTTSAYAVINCKFRRVLFNQKTNFLTS